MLYMLRILVLRFFGLFLILFLLCSIFAQESKNHITVFGGLNHVLKYGSEQDYIMGENDFPVTPAHTPPTFGLSYAYFFFNKIAVEIDFRYHLTSDVMLEDLSDWDRIKINSSRHYTFTGNFIYQILSGNFRPYLLAGAGFDSLADGKEQTLTSELGYEVTLGTPEKKTDFVVNAGAGIQFFMITNFGIRFDARYVLIPKTSDHPAINSFNFVIGAFYRF